ncbi:cohesin domain-containing protein [Sporosarcina sp. SAFN-015]|uniref:cohesin domain-containing protein n=1 Tax=Sporosarcina sp. SAFN-015 TaxID=3387274 RepID=UPI003F7F63A4
MLKKLKIFLVLSLLLMILPPKTTNAESKTLVGISTVYETRVTTVELAVFINSKESIASGSFDVEYDPELLRITETNLTKGSILSNDLTSIEGATPGNASLAFANAEGRQLDGTLLSIKATVRKSNTPIDVKLKNVQLYKEDGTEVKAQLVDGSIKDFKGRIEAHKEKVKRDKQWTITLNEAYDPATLNEHAVNVKRGSVKVDVIIKPLNAKSFTVTPKNGYLSGAHTIEITELLHSANGTKLNKPIRKTFSVE